LTFEKVCRSERFVWSCVVSASHGDFEIPMFVIELPAPEYGKLEREVGSTLALNAIYPAAKWIALMRALIHNALKMSYPHLEIDELLINPLLISCFYCVVRLPYTCWCTPSN
jgi:hypothetical protein